MTYEDILMKVYKGDLSTVPDRLLCLDPGETTGWCLFERGKLTRWGQAPTYDKVKECIDWKEVRQLFSSTNPSHAVCENYRVYAHKLERHSFSEVPTIRIIGGIELLCYDGIEDKYTVDGNWYHIPLHYQMATQAKGFVSDDKLKNWGFYQSGMKHSRDAIRHGLYYLIITNRPK